MAVDSISMFKAVLWEEAKGKLRALAQASGQHLCTETRTPNWEEVTQRIEKFINDFEADGFHE